MKDGEDIFLELLNEWLGPPPRKPKEPPPVKPDYLYRYPGGYRLGISTKAVRVRAPGVKMKAYDRGANP